MLLLSVLVVLFAVWMLMQFANPVRNAVLGVLAFLMTTQAWAQIPTGIPTEVSTAVDDGYTLLGAAVRIIIGFLACITVAKWVRALFS